MYPTATACCCCWDCCCCCGEMDSRAEAGSCCPPRAAVGRVIFTALVRRMSVLRTLGASPLAALRACHRAVVKRGQPSVMGPDKKGRVCAHCPGHYC